MPSFYFGSDNVGMASWWDWFLVLGFGEGKGREIEKKEERQGSAFWRKKKVGFVFIGFWKRFFLRLLLLLLFFVFRFFFFFFCVYVFFFFFFFFKYCIDVENCEGFKGGFAHWQTCNMWFFVPVLMLRVQKLIRYAIYCWWCRLGLAFNWLALFCLYPHFC